MSEKLTFETMKAKVWEAADILRGSIDSADYKNYIFGMLFLKRLSDVFEEEAEKIEKETGDKDAAWNDPDEHQFFVPEKARWSELKKSSSNIGDKLNKACEAIEDKNNVLEGLLASIDFNTDKLGEPKQRDATLSQLIQHFSKIPMRNSDFAEPDMLGRVYEYLIEKFADDAGKKGGEFYTPRMVVKLIVELLEPKEGMRICDPTCGSGGMLIESAHYVEQHGGNSKNLSLFGQEKNIGTWGICKMNMVLHGYVDVNIEKGDTIRDPKHVKDGQLMLFDRVIANPPFSLDKWGREEAEKDGFGRFSYGIPPKTKGDFAFVEHMIATLNSKGKLGVVVPHGVLFRGAAEGKIREGIIKDDLIEAIIGLPTNLFYGTGIPAAILIMNRDKPAERKGKIIIVNAVDEYQEGKNQNYLRDQDIEKIVRAVREYIDIDKYSRIVSLDEIKENDYNLNISRYVDTTMEEPPIDIKAVLKELKEIEVRRAEIGKKMDAYLKELGYVE
ncbi:type I restriction-modification system subunit M [Methanocella arvoryzae]|uniref:site-specific DNA-methyltransferase (adenine-specific) n=1 Tax=Methanocella arvoryzae (strain DSM 22066 / NBRC 105507 / MRE50) TaxID=351160 RepID=Q0W5N2_METAR|nr:type I restriction-modification system subunit M [Methanocella arvoryzae]CAJ36311.1 type I restriction modification system,methyltransferase subunit [Methanocella arvoryzae MRE50]